MRSGTILSTDGTSTPACSAGGKNSTRFTSRSHIVSLRTCRGGCAVGCGPVSCCGCVARLALRSSRACSWRVSQRSPRLQVRPLGGVRRKGNNDHLGMAKPTRLSRARPRPVTTRLRHLTPHHPAEGVVCYKPPTRPPRRRDRSERYGKTRT